MARSLAHRLRPRIVARTVRSLRHRDYRRFLFGHAVSVIGTWMQRVAQDWLVVQLTDNGLALGITSALQFLPTLLLGLWGGALVDRLDRRRLLIGTQTASALLAAALAVLSLTGLVQLWMVYALALGLGLVTVLDTPARQALVTDKVPPEDYANAQALNSTVHNAGRLVGPALAGVVIAVTGVGTAFAINAVSFVAVLIGLLRMAPEPPAAADARRTTPTGSLEGLRYVLARPEMTATLVLVTVIGLFGQNFRVVLPLLASDDLHSGASGYGALTSALGLGAALGALVAASREEVGLRGVVWWTVAFAATNAATALTPGLSLTLVAVTAMGIANISFNTLTRTLLQLRAEKGLQGRVISLHSLVFLGTTPLGGPLLGWWCERFGARAGLWLAAGTALLAAVAVLPILRRVKATASAGDATSSTR
ncbi:MFS transporter [Saccharopolyspora sp. K220]|uniref:MFS transporter n=1 Tax=Saccharopolyspora soli TaxID=2926618 RepID=UPI001F5932FC|nr:MFS transporter [Saccharopolyspora soli]MCI2421004.1 MFS transporter [Saccharopolyspora soli]